jgi:hypothetical protein
MASKGSNQDPGINSNQQRRHQRATKAAAKGNSLDPIVDQGVDGNNQPSTTINIQQRKDRYNGSHCQTSNQPIIHQQRAMTPQAGRGSPVAPRTTTKTI